MNSPNKTELPTGGISPEDHQKEINPLLIFFICIAVSFLLYLPVINRFFVSDDFEVINRVCREKTIFVKYFFRPLSDISIFANFLIDGLNPLVFNSFNILIHGINAFLIYRFCLMFGRRLGTGNKIQFAGISAAIFICYPFHNEAIVWILGRGASMACLLALLSILSFYIVKNRNRKILACCVFYFLSLTAFESTMPLPVVFVFLLIAEKEKMKSICQWEICFLAFFLLHMLLRYQLSGSMFGTYGEDFFHSGIKVYVLNLAKVGGRLLLPPMQHAAVLTIIFLGIAGMILFLFFKNQQRIKQSTAGNLMFCLAGMLMISAIVPVVTGVSTQTSETDRALYFPSVFLCLLLALLILYGFKNRHYRSLAISGILIYNVIFLEMNNLNWKKASDITYSVLNKISIANRLENKGRIYFLNLPNEINGAFVFRLGFQDALKLYALDTGRYIAVNYLPRQDLEKMKVKITLPVAGDEIPLPPDIILKAGSTGCREIIDHGQLKYTCRPGDHMFFWNIDELESIPTCTSPHLH